ncbi:MAG: hypothetical protein ACO1OG_10935 [Devosia sp.]
MTIEDRLLGIDISTTAIDHSAAEEARAPRSSIVEWVRLFLLRRRINAMLKRTVALPHYEDAARLPDHLRRDIGLMGPL